MNTKKFFWLFLLNVFLVSACNGQTPQPTQVETLLPTVLPTAILIPEATNTPTPTLNPDQAVSATVQVISGGCSLGSTLSPDNKWVAIKCGNMKNNDADEPSTALKIVNLSSYQEWVVTYYQIYGIQEIEHVGRMSDGIIFPANWSADGNFLYIGVSPQVYSEYLYERTAALFRLNLHSGEINEVLEPDEVQKTFYDYSVSPNEKRIAYINLSKNPLQVKIKDFDTDQFQSLSLDPKFSTAGSIVWSKDNSNIIFMAVVFNEEISYATTTIFEWDNQEKRLKEIGQLTDRLFFIVKWNEDDKRITLRDYFKEEFFELDIISGQLTPVSP